MYYHNPKLTYNARQLRKNMTPQERHLWYDFLRTYSVRFIRQKVIGEFICDFYCAKAKLVVEIDGSQHFDEKNIKDDSVRTEYLKSLGIMVVRFSNYDVNVAFDSVCEQIDILVTERTTLL